MKVPDAVGVPLMVSVLDDHAAVTPVGNPVAPVVVRVMFVKGVLMHKVGVEEALPAVFAVVTVIVPVALTQPPVKGIL